MPSDTVIVFMTVPDEAKGAEIGKTLVTEGLAACCNIVPAIRSIYKWKGEVCDEGEALCIMKTRAALFKTLEKRAKELHPYEVPEIICVDIKDAHQPYLSWISEVTK
ncbi:MAG: divalent-cation tolerance protein CutA [Deltaproteobacteria bacterium]|nr:divalent-cation tolerance protein CutA [Deltaproteobacteria bacterium]